MMIRFPSTFPDSPSVPSAELEPGAAGAFAEGGGGAEAAPGGDRRVARRGGAARGAEVHGESEKGEDSRGEGAGRGTDRLGLRDGRSLFLSGHIGDC